ncbi:GTP-binding protein, putative [Plasmodium gallinaceum]|uniref:GTP-binding protein, putative n=1 Tax=Plasmodium gallinaceum TaxID=5849 RepID=A0A1J1GUA2_PLAGA|nr:GTP-binding protein, putative [Plasmodium gallinaceum]CRG94617.1 GTP-binding protein, putative [Plasmodium gallinaceum]
MYIASFFFRKYSSINNKLNLEKIKNVNRISEDITSNNISRRKREKNMKLDIKIYENLKKKMLGKPLNKLQKKYINEKCPNFAPVFLDQLKPRMTLYRKAIQVSELPLPKYPEVAFIGRSNCGKSTLINELCGRTNKAKVSKLPGCTKEIHFYKIAKPCLLCLVDLPGYGFAYSKEELRLQWNEFTLFYLKNRKNLKKVFVLIDCRVGLKNSDRELLHFFDRNNIKYQIILSKCDLLNTKDLTKKIQIINEEIKCFKNKDHSIIPLSSLKRQNLNELRNEIAKYQLNKTIVKNNIIMKINDLMEQKKLKKLKEKKNDENESENQNKNSIFSFNSNILDEKKKKEKNTDNISKDILLSNETVFEALNRWKINDKISTDISFNKYMNYHIKYLITLLQKNFLNNCYNEYNKNDLKIIDEIIENYDKPDHDNINEISSINHSENLKENFVGKKRSFKKRTYMNSKQSIHEEEMIVKENNNNNITNNSNINLIMKNNINNIFCEDSLNEKDNLNKCDINGDKSKDESIYNIISDINYIENNKINEHDKCNNKTKIENCFIKNKEERIIDKLNDKKTFECSNNFLQNEIHPIESVLFYNSLLKFDKNTSIDFSCFHSENVKMDKLFDGNSENKKLIDNFQEKNYSNIKNDIILEEDETYSPEDYASGLKKPMKTLKNDSLYNFEFNINDKSTHYIYEKNKSEAYKIFKSKQLENLHDENNFSSSQREKKKNINSNNSSTNVNNLVNDHNSKRNDCSTEKYLEKKVENNEENTKKKYIGLKTRNEIIKGTKKLKLFGKKKEKEIINVPTDLATDYFKLSNNSTFYNKKKSSWNYISSKYNKWLKKAKHKNISSEITGSIKKEDVMIRYAKKHETKYKKEKNKLLRQKKNLCMITKPPSHNKFKKISRNYTLSDEQKIFDREAFFKYRDVKK